MSQPIAQQATTNNKTVYVAIKRFSVLTGTIEESKRYLLRHIKLGRDRVDRLKEEKACCDRENYVMTRSKTWRT